MLFVPSSEEPSRQVPGDHTSAPLIAISEQPIVAPRTESEFEKEQAMSPTQLMDRWAPFIKEASRRFGMSEAWIKAVMRQESGGRTMRDNNRPITSDAGAMGVMQVMPDTYAEMRQQHGLGADAYDPHDNVLAGTAYLRWLYGKYGYPEMFAAYNAGPGTLEAQLAGVRRLPDETHAYVSAIEAVLGTKSNPSQFVNPLVTLTRPDGSLISIDAAVVDSIREPLPDEYAASVQTVVTLGNRQQGVREDVATVVSVIRSHGGKVTATKNSLRRASDQPASTKT